MRVRVRVRVRVNVRRRMCACVGMGGGGFAEVGLERSQLHTPHALGTQHHYDGISHFRLAAIGLIFAAWVRRISIQLFIHFTRRRSWPRDPKPNWRTR